MGFLDWLSGLFSGTSKEKNRIEQRRPAEQREIWLEEQAARKVELDTLQRISRDDIRVARKLEAMRRRELHDAEARRRKEVKEPFRVMNWLKSPVIPKQAKKNAPPKFHPK